MKHFIAIVASFVPVIVFSQIKIVNQDLLNTDAAIVYKGIPNHLKIEGILDINQMKITTTNSTFKTEKNVLTVDESKIGFDTIRIYSNKKLIFTSIFRVDKINNPVAQLAFTLDSVISLNRILANPYLSVKIPGYLSEINFGIVAFQCSLQKANSSNYIFSDDVSGNKLTKNMLDLIQKMVTGDKIIFDEIKAFGPGGDIRKLPGFTVTIK